MADREAELERSFEALARALDEVGPEREVLFLSKLALTLADRVGAAALDQAIEIAKRDLR